MKRVLLVEDNAACRLTIGTIIEQAGWQLDTAGSFAEAVKCLLGGTHYDLVLSDVVLGDGLGGDLSHLCSCRFVAYSGRTHPEVLTSLWPYVKCVPRPMSAEDAVALLKEVA